MATPHLLTSFASTGTKEEIPVILQDKGWSPTNPNVHGYQLNELFFQLFGFANYVKKKGFSEYDSEEDYFAYNETSGTEADIVRVGNKIYFAKQDNGKASPKSPVTNPDYWELFFDFSKPIYTELAKYALKNGSASNLFKVKDAVADDEAVSKKQVETLLNQVPTVPTGLVVANPSLTIPAGFLECNGAELSRTTYADLFAVIGTTYGTGDGSTTFNIPDLRGEFIRGFDNGRGVDSGRSIGTWQKGTVIGFDNDTAGASESVNHGISNGDMNSVGADNISLSDYPSLLEGLQTYSTVRSATSLYSGVVRPRNIAMIYCIKY